MRIPPSEWIKANEAFTLPAGRSAVRVLRPCSLVLEADGFLSPLGYGSQWSVCIPEAAKVSFDGDPGAVWFWAPYRPFVEDSGEVFTNMDKEPGQGGAVADVRASLRRLQLLEMELTQKIRAAASARPVVDPETGEVLASPSVQPSEASAGE